MPTLDWLKNEFHYGYQSGDILAPEPDEIRKSEETRCGGDYRAIFLEAILPRIGERANVLELGPGKGSWSRAVLQSRPACRLQTVDFQDVTQWLEPERWNGRLVCHRVSDSTFSCLEPGSIDFFFSFGVLCHNNTSNIESILKHALSRMRPGAYALHQHSDWKKLDRFGWERGMVPVDFRSKPDDEIWWPRNDGETMERLAKAVGWEVVQRDIGMIQRDGFILLRAPESSGRSVATSNQETGAELVARGLEQLQAGRFDAALATSASALERIPLAQGAHMLQAAALLRLNRDVEGLASLRREIEAFPGNADARAALEDLEGKDSAPIGSAGNTRPSTLDEAAVLLNIGCGSTFHPRWMNYDLAPSNPQVRPIDARLRFEHPDGSVDAIYHSHLLEHLARADARTFLLECHRMLRPGGILRVAVPDLEQIARQYLRELDSALAGDRQAATRRDWMVMELLDQVARHESGGEMMRWWAQNPVPAETFIVARVGSEARNAIRSLRDAKLPPPSGNEPLSVGNFRLSGEVHRWMYDQFSLGQLLSDCGFSAHRKVLANESAIAGFAGFGLETESDGSLRKPDSLFMEARR